MLIAISGQIFGNGDTCPYPANIGPRTSQVLTPLAGTVAASCPLTTPNKWGWIFVPAPDSGLQPLDNLFWVRLDFIHLVDIVVSHILLGLLVAAFVGLGAPVVIGVDETLERRQGEKIKAKGFFGIAPVQAPSIRCIALACVG